MGHASLVVVVTTETRFGFGYGFVLVRSRRFAARRRRAAAAAKGEPIVAARVAQEIIDRSPALALALDSGPILPCSDHEHDYYFGRCLAWAAAQPPREAPRPTSFASFPLGFDDDDDDDDELLAQLAANHAATESTPRKLEPLSCFCDQEPPALVESYETWTVRRRRNDDESCGGGDDDDGRRRREEQEQPDAESSTSTEFERQHHVWIHNR